MENENSELVFAEVEGTEVEVIQPQLLAPDRAEFDVQIATAKQYPRSIKGFKAQAMGMATIDEATAASCFYVLVRGGKKIEGPGVRLSEIVALSWGNLRYGSQIVGETEDRKNIIAEGFCHDLQTNNRVALRVIRRITDKRGQRYSDDMIAVTGNAAASIALRNAIFKIVPMTYVNSIYQAAKQLAVGDAKSLSERRLKMLEHFSKYGVTQERLLARVGKPSIEDVTLEDMELLVGLSTSIKDGELDIDSAFPVASKGGAKESLAEKIKAKADAKK